MSNNDDQSPTMPAAAVDPPSHVGNSLPENIGPYRVLGRLGEGGMGTVYKAEQRIPVRRTVAIKVVKLGMDTNEVIARFESERQALSRMDHPGIARVLDAGADERGRPYFVMEFVPGVPITTYADRDKMPLKDRLHLFLQVCDAIAHAHSKAILHRDIKASNVLAFTDGAGHPIAKVIDFGVAKALTSDRLTDRTFNTQMGLAVGTYESMSPEQADGSADVDARTDVYALGVLLYELLAGAKPLGGNMAAGTADVEIRRIIRDVDPPRPSVKMTALGKEGMTRAAADRRLAPSVLAKELKSELEWIPMMCLRKERDRRYASPLLLAADVRNYLEGLPLMAGPDSRWYRVSKLARRNKGKLAAAAIVLLVLLAGIGGTTWGLFREARQRRVAEQEKQAADTARIAAEEERKNSQIVVDFLTQDILAKASPDNTGDAAASDLLVKTLIDPAIATVDARFQGQPRVRAKIQQTLAKTLEALGQYDAALVQARAALAARQGALGDDNPDTLESTQQVLECLIDLHREKDAEPLARDTLARWQRLRGDDDRQTIGALTQLGRTLNSEARAADAEPLLKQSWDRARRVLGEDDVVAIDALFQYATALDNQNRPAAAEPLYKQAWERYRRVLGDENSSTNNVLQAYGRSLFEQRRYKDAEALYQQAWQRDLKVLGEKHPSTIDARNYYISALVSLGRVRYFGATTRPAGPGAAACAEADELLAKHQYAAAEPLYRKAIELDRAAGDAGRSGLAIELLGLGDSLRYRKSNSPEALDDFRQAEEILRADRPASDLVRIDTDRTFAQMLLNAGKLEESIDIYRQAVAADDDTKADRYFRTEDRMSLAKAQEKNKDLSGAEATLREALTLRQASPRWGHTGKETQATARQLAALLEKENKPADAAAIRADAGITPTTRP